MRVWTRSLAAFGLATALAGCAQPTTPAQVAADLSGVLQTLQQIEPVIVQTDPGAFTPQQIAAMAYDLAEAQSVLATFSAGMPAAAGAALAAEIDGYLNDAVGTLAAVAPLVPALAPFSPALDAIDAILPAVESFVNSTLARPAPILVVRARRVPAMTPDQGRKALGIPVIAP